MSHLYKYSAFAKQRPLRLIACRHCGTEFSTLRSHSRFCSPRCRQAARRILDAIRDKPAPKPQPLSQIAPSGPPAAEEWKIRVRIWGPNRLSEIELRMLGLAPTGERFPGGAIYERVC